MAHRLLITDHYDSPAFAQAASGTSPGDTWDVFLLGGTPDWFRWRHPGQVNALPDAHVVDASALAPEAHRVVSEYVLALSERLPATDLGGQTLCDLLDGPDGNAWWYLETSEKGAYRTPLVGQLYRLALVRLAVQRASYTDVLFSIREQPLATAISAAMESTSSWRMAESNPLNQLTWLERHPFARLIIQQVRGFGRFVATTAFLWWARLPRSSSVGGRWVFTAFPTWWTATHTPTPRDRFFTSLSEATVGGYLALLTEPGRLWRHRHAARRALRDRRMLPLNRYLSLADGLSLFAPRRFRRLWRFERDVRRHLSETFLGFDVSRLIADDIRWSLSGYESIQDEWLARAMRRAVSALTPSLVLYRAEFQPAESAIAWGIGRRARAIGYQHHPFGRKYLQMQFTATQMADSLADVPPSHARPLPDGMIAIGPALADHVVEGGYPRSRVAVCGPQRYGPLIRYRREQPTPVVLREKLGIASDAFVVVVALAIVESDTEALFGALVAGCDDMADLRIIVRTHPNRPQGDPALEAALDALGRTRAVLMPPDAAIYDYIAAADCMVCVGSMIAFEAMALGIMPIVVDNPSAFGAISLAEYDSALFVVRNAAELKVAVTAVRSGSPAAASRRAEWPRMLDRVMGDLQRPLGTQMDAALDTFDPPA